jgi:hypothetical protein
MYDNPKMYVDEFRKDLKESQKENKILTSQNTTLTSQVSTLTRDNVAQAARIAQLEQKLKQAGLKV